MARKQNGFTLIELSVALTIMTILMIGLAGLVMRNLNAWRLEEGLSDLNAALRICELQIAQEVADAGVTDIGSAGLTGIAVGGGGTSVTFQRPLLPDPAAVPIDQNGDGVIDMIDALIFFPDVLAGQTWTNPITLQFVNEDVNGNLILDPGEDTDGNGRLDRNIQRLQDGVGIALPDGDFNDVGEQRIVAQNIDTLVFALNGNQLNVAVTTRRRIDGPVNNQVNDALNFSLQLIN